MSSMTSGKRVAAFRKVVWAHYKKSGRHDLPWRKTRDPYKILVSEIMLQQTQVPRVIPKYTSFIKRFPTVRALAKAPLAIVLKEWSGLGYNRRAKYLHDAATQLSARSLHTNFPVGKLVCRGIGPYTRAAVETFAYNRPNVLIETNIRTVFIHHFFPERGGVADSELLPLVEKAAERQDPRTWYWALMDYGAYLKQSGVRNNAKSRHYTKQSRFKGSLREVRGAILKAIHSGKGPEDVRFPKTKIRIALASLRHDGLVPVQDL